MSLNDKLTAAFTIKPAPSLAVASSFSETKFAALSLDKKLEQADAAVKEVAFLPAAIGAIRAGMLLRKAYQAKKAGDAVRAGAHALQAAQIAAKIAKDRQAKKAKKDPDADTSGPETEEAVGKLPKHMQKKDGSPNAKAKAASAAKTAKQDPNDKTKVWPSAREGKEVGAYVKGLGFKWDADAAVWVFSREKEKPKNPGDYHEVGISWDVNTGPDQKWIITYEHDGIPGGGAEEVTAKFGGLMAAVKKVLSHKAVVKALGSSDKAVPAKKPAAPKAAKPAAKKTAAAPAKKPAAKAKAWKAGATVSIPIGMETRAVGTVVSGPHPVPADLKRDHVKAWGGRAPSTFYKIKVKGFPKPLMIYSQGIRAAKKKVATTDKKPAAKKPVK